MYILITQVRKTHQVKFAFFSKNSAECDEIRSVKTLTNKLLIKIPCYSIVVLNEDNESCADCSTLNGAKYIYNLTYDSM
jgi:hypothetical protein